MDLATEEEKDEDEFHDLHGSNLDQGMAALFASERQRNERFARDENEATRTEQVPQRAASSQPAACPMPLQDARLFSAMA